MARAIAQTDTDIAIEQTAGGIVMRNHHRPSGIPDAGYTVPGILAEQSLETGVDLFGTERALAQGAQ